jgi:outer membrane PBP1 activator LpoA protein
MISTNITGTRPMPAQAADGVGTGAVTLVRRAALVGALLAVAWLASGCITTGGGAAGGAAREAAAELAAAGNHAEAARTLEAALAQTSGDTRDALLLDAARQWFLAGNRPRAIALTAQRVSPLPEEGDALTHLLAAAGALSQEQPEQALSRLQRIPTPYPASLSADVYELLGRSHFRRGSLLPALRALTQRELWLTNDADVAGNSQLIWAGLRENPGMLRTVSPVGDPVIDGWLALARLTTADAGPGRLRGDLFDWQQRYPGHPAAQRIVPALFARYRSLTEYPARIALLLPLSGPLEQSAAAVRDGFIAAQLAASADGIATEIDVYDTETLGPGEAYAQAVNSGVDFIVGPLRKEAVSEVASATRRVPTLALNDPGATALLPGGDFYRFALSPEDEAEQAAIRAASEGYRNFIALIPNSSWGERLLSGFQTGLSTAEGAMLVDYGYYPSSASDFSAAIRRVLRLDQSDERYKALRSIIAEPIEFEPRRRADVDALLVAAPASVAQLIRPQLRFHFAADLPVFMTSAALTPQADQNRDLGDVTFADIPWLAADAHLGDPRWQALVEYAPDGVRRARLFALGADAFSLVPAIWSGVDADDDVLLDGLTGTLHAERDGRIARELAFLTLQRGELVALPALPPPTPPQTPGETGQPGPAAPSPTGTETLGRLR